MHSEHSTKLRTNVESVDDFFIFTSLKSFSQKVCGLMTLNKENK